MRRAWSVNLSNILSAAFLGSVSAAPDGNTIHLVVRSASWESRWRFAARVPGLAACGLAWLSVGHRNVGAGQADRQGRQPPPGCG